ncbi:MAG: nitrogenase molybdenum-iron protein, partial [Pseudobutyrivibrio sp.]|nr:nitrogenase molybdenum-iron protein [Pseudobutyrivibrio sp.]
FSESVGDVAAIVKLLNILDIEYQVLPQFSTIAEIRAASRAKATIVLNPEEGGYFAKELNEVFNVPYIISDAPIGFRGTKNFLLKLAGFLKIEDKAIAYIDEMEEELTKNISKDIIDGKNVFIDASLSRIPAYARLFQNLGGNVVGFSSPFIDLDNRKQLLKLDFLSKGATAIIGNGQYFEKANAIKKAQVDIYVSEFLGSVFAADEDATVLSTRNIVTYGFDGVLEINNSLKRVLRLTGKLGNSEDSIYKASWKRKSGNWYVKQEVS